MVWSVTHSIGHRVRDTRVMVGEGMYKSDAVGKAHSAGCAYVMV